MDPETIKKIDALELKIDAVYKSVKRIQLYFLITTIITVAAIVLPLIGLAFVIPQFISSLNVSSITGGY